ncbi:MAG TPA: PrpF domain-containing protein [Pseudonocardiaceae bacterium]
MTESGAIRVPATLMRGGTSKCWVFDADMLDALPVDVESVLLAAYGSDDPRQIDGVGGATSTTSKAMMVRAANRPDSDIEYTFGQVGIGAHSVEWGSNCGNCATAVGLYAVQTGLVPVRSGRTEVRMFNTNTGARLRTTIDTPGGIVPEVGTATVPGVHAGGVAVDLAFLDPAGDTTGKLLPTGRGVDLLGEAGIPATLVDAGAPAVLIPADALGLTGLESPDELLPHVDELAILRRAAALKMGLATPADPISYAVPKIGIVGPAYTYHDVDDMLINVDDIDVSVRMISMHAPHPAIGLTSAVAIAAAATVPDGVVAELLAGQQDRRMLRIGTPAGVITARTEFDADGALTGVALARAARRIAVAEVFVPISAPALAAS